MAKTPERLYELVQQDPRGCTLAQMEKLLTAHGFEGGRRSRNGKTRVWAYLHVTLTIHKPHERTMKIRAVKQALAEIDRAVALQEQEEAEGPVN